jgi:hypothetical protein
MQKENQSKLPSNRSFGFMFAGIFTLLSCYKAYHEAELFVVYAWLVIGLAVGFAAIFSPSFLSPFNSAWMKLGDLMGKVISPLVLGIIFFILITPTAVLTRLFGRNELRLNFTNSKSYWIDRSPPGPERDSFKNQF